MTDSIETPSLFPEETAPKKPARRKTAAAPRKPRATKAAAETQPADAAEPVEKPAPKKARKSAAAAPKKAPVKRTRKTAAAEPVTEPVAEPVAPAEPAAEPAAVAAPVVEAPAPAPAEPVQQPVTEAPVPAAFRENREPRENRERRERGGRGRGGRNNRRGGPRSRENSASAFPGVTPPAYAGAVVEEWSPGGKAVAAQAAPEPRPAPAPVPQAAKPEELVLRRHREQQAAPQPQQQMSREERIAAARQQFIAAEPPLQEQAPASVVPPLPEAPRPEPVYAEGIIEVSGKGFGFLRDPKRSFAQHPNDVFVTPEVCRRYTLRDGMWIRGEIRRGNRGPQLFRLTEIEGEDPEKFRTIPLFDELTTINPNHFVKLETVPDRFTTRVIDLMAPIGRGQRGLIVAPPRTGKTTLLQHIAEAVVANHPDMKLIILLVDERPEEVTEIRRAIPQAELMASSNDQELKSHTRIAQLAVERARRLVEMGKHVFILLDSITRVGRAFNNAMAGGGRTMSGGVDARALEIPRKLFAAARNTEEAGSLTIIATALIETGSRMDELIFQEFKGTGNMELVLDRKVSDLRIYPAVDIFMSGTRREELLLPEADLHKINIIRRGLAGHKPAEAIERLLFFLKKFPTNSQMLREIPG